MKYFITILSMVMVCFSCTEAEEGLLGEWEGKTELVNNKGVLVESEISCTIRSGAGSGRNVILEVGGTDYEFAATESMNVLTYDDSRIENDTTGRSYITGQAELLNDTLLHFNHEVYAMMGGALLYSDKFRLEMVRK